MKAIKMIDRSVGKVPVIAALPYSISFEESEKTEAGTYVPSLQLTHHISNGYSTCSYDESAGGIFESKRDTQKDD
jgi:hypothetical protein